MLGSSVLSGTSGWLQWHDANEYLPGRRGCVAIQESRARAYRIIYWAPGYFGAVFEAPWDYGDFTALRGSWSLINNFTANHGGG